MSSKTWSDQPDEIEDAERLCSFAVGDSQVEIRHNEAGWYMTIGNLFHSQTLRADTPQDILRAVDTVKARRRPPPPGLPTGCSLLPNSEQGST